MGISDKSQPEVSLPISHLTDKSTMLPLKPLGAVLQRAGLISSSQIEMALQRQEQHLELRIGDILAREGWLKPKTADFFAEKFWNLLTRQPKQPLGYYLKEAALLDERQIAVILSEQQQVKLKFGELAVQKGWLKPATLDFFLEYLVPGYTSGLKRSKNTENWNVRDRAEYEQNIRDRFLKIRLKLLHLEGVGNLSPRLLKEVLSWTGGQSFLTQKLCQLISASGWVIAPGEEAFRVRQLVLTKIVNDWKNQEGAKHFQHIRDRLLDNQQCSAKRLLKTYQAIYFKDVLADDSPEQGELLNLGLVVEQQHKLKVANPIYQAVFNARWLERELGRLSNFNSQNTLAIAETGNLVVSQKQDAKAQKKSNWLNIMLFLGLAGLLFLFSQFIVQRWQVKTLFGRGNELLRQQEYENALSQYDKLLNIDSNYYQAWTNRGYALAGLADYDKMLASCSSATIIEPEAVYAWNCKGEALYNLQRYEEAIAEYDRAIELAPQDPVFWINKSEAFTSLKQYDESLNTINRAITLLETIEKTQNNHKINGEFAVAWNYKAKMLAAKQQYQDAIAAYNRSLEYLPQYFPSQIGKGVALKQLHRYAEASKTFRDILDNNTQLTDPRKAGTWFYLGKTLCESSQKNEAIAAFEEALKLKPDYQDAAIAKENCR
jgi:tetratricopeptide (TPR) repeat protein